MCKMNEPIKTVGECETADDHPWGCGQSGEYIIKIKKKSKENIMTEPCDDGIYVMVREGTEHFTKILSTVEIKEKYKDLYWGGNGVGDRWAKKKFNYSVIFSNKPPSLYSENEMDKIQEDILKEFLQTNKGKGIIGIFVHSIRKNTVKRPICKNIQTEITGLSCVVCGTHATICDHKNDLYNDIRVLDVKTQLITDFQPLCNHCNLQKRQVCKMEEQTNKIYSAKNIQRYTIYPFEFPWEKKAFDRNDTNCKKGTYWYDPVEFEKNIYYYSTVVVPMLNELKMNKLKSMS